jgi:predicted O-methyltransferase YrrM
MRYYTIKKYLQYRLFSSHKRGHGIHSPFVFELIEMVFRNKTVPAVVLDIEKLRVQLKADKRQISVNDLGSGSKKIKGRLRKVADIARYSPVPPKYGRILTNMAHYFGDNGILELGTSLGISTMYLAAGQKEGRVYTIEGCSGTLSLAIENFAKCGFGNIISFGGSFDEMIPEFCREKVTPGVVFIDGDHRKDSVLRYFEKAKEFTGDASAIILDDIHISTEMGEAWEVIKKDNRVSVTIDINRFGIVFFRKGMTRSDYVIRY